MKTAAVVILDLLRQAIIVLAVMGISLLLLWDPAESDAQANPVVVQTTQESILRDIQETKRTYTGQLEEYRQLNQQFIVAQQQFVQLGTLTSLESAVQATKRATAIRDQVLITYLRQLELELANSQGIEIELKDQATYLLTETSKALSRHLELVNSSNDRQSIADQAAQFANVEPLFSYTTEYVKRLIVVGKLRVSYDQAQGILRTISQEESGLSELQQGARDRALAEIATSLQQADQQLTLAEEELLASLETVEFRRRSTASENAYVTLTQTANYLEELARQ